VIRGGSDNNNDNNYKRKMKNRGKEGNRIREGGRSMLCELQILRRVE
jgi:hypothetical protein